MTDLVPPPPVRSGPGPGPADLRTSPTATAPSGRSRTPSSHRSPARHRRSGRRLVLAVLVVGLVVAAAGVGAYLALRPSTQAVAAPPVVTTVHLQGELHIAVLGSSSATGPDCRVFGSSRVEITDGTGDILTVVSSLAFVGQDDPSGVPRCGASYEATVPVRDVYQVSVPHSTILTDTDTVTRAEAEQDALPPIEGIWTCNPMFEVACG